MNSALRFALLIIALVAGALVWLSVRADSFHVPPATPSLRGHSGVVRRKTDLLSATPIASHLGVTDTVKSPAPTLREPKPTAEPLLGKRCTASPISRLTTNVSVTTFRQIHHGIYECVSGETGVRFAFKT